MIHRFVCDKCGHTVEDENTKIVHVCPCGEDMRWDLTGQCHFRGDYEHTSDALAIHPDDIPAHRAKFPNVDILPDGRPKFNSVRQQQRYSEACGFTKRPQKIRSLGRKRIA
jgi:predicted RNA-binding Zn-ribbon protein involved in translation (DUF1610 family)